MWKYSWFPPNPNEIITNLLKMNYKLYKKCRYTITITTKIFLLKILFIQKNPELYISVNRILSIKIIKKINIYHYLYYHLIVASIIPYIITSVSLGFVIFLFANVVHHTLSK